MTLNTIKPFKKFDYEPHFSVTQGDALGLSVFRGGRWNLTLRDYSQTTRIKRDGSGVDVHVEVDHIGDMDIHVGNLLRGRGILGQYLGRFSFNCILLNISFDIWFGFLQSQFAERGCKRLIAYSKFKVTLIIRL